MNARHMLFLSLATIALVALLHIVGIYFQFYWRIGWYDRIVHILGGIWAAFIILALTHKRSLTLGIVAAIIMGLIWEYFELKSGVTAFNDIGFMKDTLGDIVSDIVGGVAGSVMVRNLSKHNQEREIKI